ncbi:two-component regulator propeller domain-containing protein [Corallococcus macrosporus]|uniref:histidine kinase n=1 Tax=Corallococcus macrosporus DSM 14697 TaxID=1189310 RepID=A0A286NVQ6_9BACT|nr:two-component regulator propeller domain-containing protein [Corallococcus macrosporus]ATB51251.1 histidine kinase [Corallococcus macrosporus DSM 14697]
MRTPGQRARALRRGFIGWFFFAGLFLATPGMALDPQRRVSQYSQDVWRSDDGLPQNSLLSMVQTRDGYLWLGTWEGLARFDGARFTVFDRRNAPELRNHTIKALAEDASGTLWLGTGQGLVAYRQGRFERAPGAAASLESARVETLVAADGVLWVGTSAGLWQVPLGEGVARQYTVADGLPASHVTSLTPGEGTSLWVGTPEGLARWVDGRLEPAPFPFPGPEPRPYVMALRRDATGVLWLGTREGLYSWNGVVARRFTTDEGLPTLSVNALSADSDGNLWVGTQRGGLTRHNAKGFSEPVPGMAWTAEAAVLSLLEDRDGHLWVGTYSGLMRLRDGPFATYGIPEGLADETVSAVLEDRRGVLWLGTTSGLFRYEDKTFHHVGAEQGLPESVIPAMHEAPDGTLWVGTLNGAYRYDGQRFTRVSRAQGLPHDVVTAILVDSRGNTWLGTQTGLARLHAGGVTVYGPKQGFTNPIIVMVEDARGRVWFGSDTGLARWDGEQKGFQRFTQQDGLPGDLVLALHADPDGTVWVGTETGLGRWRDDTWARWTMAQGLYDDAVFSLVPDGDGSLWMSSNKGVSRVSRRDLEAVADGERPRLTTLDFDTRDGMRSAECNGNTQPSAWRGQDGRLWFTNLRGAIVVDPVRVRASRQPPEVRIEEVRVQGKPVPVEGPVELEPGASRLEIRFTAFTPVDAARLPFRYRLVGHDDTWVHAEARRALYNSLRPGSYRFEVQAKGRDDGWTEPVSLDVVLEAKLWQRTGFWLLCVLGVGVLGVSVYLLRVGQLKDRERWLAERVKDRTQALARANAELEANMRTLRQAQAQLVQTGRLAAVGQLAAGVGHEINNPLAYIVSNLEHASDEADALARELDGTRDDVGARLKDVNQALREALLGADRVRRIVQDLKMFSRPDDEKQGPVALHAVLDSAVKIAMGELRPRAKLVRDYGDVPRVEGNEARLAQVFLNLLINAAQALPEGHAESNEVRLVTRLGPDGRVVAEVRDTGSGISPELLGRIFDPFYTTKPVGVGTGLGLSLCHAYLTAMGGTIAVDSEAGRGSVFRVTLRAASEDTAPGQPASAPPPHAKRTAGEAAGSDTLAAGQENAGRMVMQDVNAPGGVSPSPDTGPSMGGAGEGAPASTHAVSGEAPSTSPDREVRGGASPAGANADTPVRTRPRAEDGPAASAPALSSGGTGSGESPAMHGARPEPQATPAPEAARGRVLVVDDDALVSGAIRRTLSRENDVEVLVSARRALELLTGAEARYDVVLCDLMMPEMTGMDLYDALARVDPRAAERIVFITGGAFTATARTFLERVGNPRVEKPFDPEALRQLVRSEVARARREASGRAA